MKTEALDLKIGDPVFMREYWELIGKLYANQVGRSAINISEEMGYDYDQTMPVLKEQIERLHKIVGNAETEGYEIVIGNGISQLISASTYAFRLRHASRVYAQSPHWNRFEFLCKLGAQAAHPNKFSFHEFSPEPPRTHESFTDTEPCRKTLEIITYPNNPDNSCKMKDTFCTWAVHDLCYYWPQYTQPMAKFAFDVMLFGLSKATGHAGSRIGWALVKDKELAKDMRKFIMLNTSGVSLDAQIRAAEVIHAVDTLRTKDMMSCFDCGKRELDKRWFDFLFAAGKTQNFKVLNDSGMFAWCEWKETKATPQNGAKEFEKKYNILALEGASFGNPRDDARKFRINLGCSKQDFADLIERLTNE